MRTKAILSMLILTAAVLSFTFDNAEAGGVPGNLIPPGLPGSSVNVHVNGYLPAPPGVNVQIDAGRPYYVESNRRVYIEREPSRHDNRRHYKKYKKHHRDHGDKHGHYKEEHGGHGGRGGHGR